MALFEPLWASDDQAPITTPTSDQIEAGFNCGEADPGLFNWLFQQLQSTINTLNIGDMASKFRLINTTEGIAGGGSLEADRTLRLNIQGLEEKSTVANDDMYLLYDPVANAHRKTSRASFVAGLGGSGGSISNGANIGDGPGLVFSGLSGSSMQFRSLKDAGGLVVTTTGNVVNVAIADRGAELTYA